MMKPISSSAGALHSSIKRLTADQRSDSVAAIDGIKVETHQIATLVQEVSMPCVSNKLIGMRSGLHLQVVDRRNSNSLRARSSKRSYDIRPQKRLETLRHSSPQIAETQQQRSHHEDRSLAKVIRHRHPEEIKRSQNKDRPYQKSANFCLCFLELEAEDIEGRGKASNGVVGQEGEGTYTGKADVLLPSRPPQRIVGIIGIWGRMKNQMAIFRGRVQLYRAFGIVDVFERVHGQSSLFEPPDVFTTHASNQGGYEPPDVEDVGGTISSPMEQLRR
jgi:hypothetical protein